MKTLKVMVPFERLDVVVGDETVRCMVDCRDSRINRIAAMCIEASDEVSALDAARERGASADELDAMSRRVAGIIGPVIVEGIGQESYDAILAACGDGEPVEPHECNLVMAQVFAAVSQAVVERLSQLKESKAIHYLQDAAGHAKP